MHFLGALARHAGECGLLFVFPTQPRALWALQALFPIGERPPTIATPATPAGTARRSGGDCFGIAAGAQALRNPEQTLLMGCLSLPIIETAHSVMALLRPWATAVPI